MRLTAGRTMYRVYDGTFGYDAFNPGFGDARFSPFDHPGTQTRVPAMYLADDEESALLETVFHDVTAVIPVTARTIYERHLVDQLLVHMRTPREFVVGDLRDPALAGLGLDRAQVVSSPAEHYPCTRRLAVQAVGRAHAGEQLDGLIWHSRQAELAGRPDAEVAVIFGHRTAPTPGNWPRVPPGSRNLYEGEGRRLVEEIAHRLDATIET